MHKHQTSKLVFMLQDKEEYAEEDLYGTTVGGLLNTETGGLTSGATAGKYIYLSITIYISIYLSIYTAGNPTVTATTAASSKTGTSGTSRVSTAGQTTPAIKTAGLKGGSTLCVNCISLQTPIK